MAVIKAISSHAPINTALDYVMRKEKTEEKLLSGVGCNPETVKEEMESTKELYGKTGGRTYKHFVQSFAPDESISHEKAHEIAKKLVNSTDLFQGYEVLIATHQDKNHIHSHFVVNSVNYKDGRKFQMSSKDLQRLKDKSDEICKEYGLSICEKGKSFDGSERKSLVAWVKDTYQYLKSELESENSKSYICNIKDAIQEVKSTACSIEEYKKGLEKFDISIKWEENRKYITYKNGDGHRVRDKKLKSLYNLDADKTSLLKQFEINMQKDNKVFKMQENLLVSKYKVEFYRNMQADMSYKIKGQEQMISNIKEKIDKADKSILKLQNDIDRWTQEKECCSKTQFKVRYELQEKIEHAEMLLDTIQEDKENFLCSCGLSSQNEVEELINDLQEVKEISARIKDELKNEEENLKTWEKAYADLEQASEMITDEVIKSVSEELEKVFNEDFSKEMLQKMIDDMEIENPITYSLVGKDITM